MKTIVYKVAGTRTTKAAYEKALAEGRTDVDKIVYHDGLEIHMGAANAADDIDMDEVGAEMDAALENLDAGEAEAPADEEPASDDNKGWWKPWLVALVILALAGHIVWCLTHHMDGQQPGFCTTCNKVETSCICQEVRTDLLKQVAELEAQLAAQPSVAPAVTPEAITICGICGSNGDCNCKAKYDEALAQNEYITKLINSGECTGLCPVHCVEHEEATATPKPTAKPTATPTAKPTAKPTATPTAKPTAKPTATPTAKPTTEPTTAPTACPHSSTKKVEGERTELGNGEWIQECYKVCKACGAITDTFYRGGMNVDAAIPTVTNSVEIEDDGEAGKPI